MRVADTERERRFDALFEAYLPDMVAYCGWRAPSAADAQDAVSEVFLAAWRRLDEVPEGEEARFWLYGTARRVIANQARANRRRSRLEARLCAVSEPVEEAPGRHDELDSPAEEAVRLALRTLDPADREVLLLAEWEGLSPAGIAKVMHCQAVTARGRLFRARRRFRAAFEHVAPFTSERGVDIDEEASATADRTLIHSQAVTSR